MSDTPPPADGWRQGPDGKWYGPDQQVPPAPSPPPPSKEADGGWSTAVGQGTPPKPNDGSGNRGCVWVVLIVIVLAAIGAAVGDDDNGGRASGTGASTDEPNQDELEFGAFDVCTKFVKDRLKAPSTASFRNFFEEDGEVLVSGSGNGPYTVISSVDAENGFGANIRTDFVCEVQHTGGGKWRLVNLGLDE